MGATELPVAHVILRRLLHQAAVRNDGGFPQKSLSALGDLCWSKMSGKLKKPLGLEPASLPCGWHGREFSVDAF